MIWGTRFFGPWDPVEPVASVDSCKGVYWKAFGPPKIADGAVFVWEMSVDGSVCQTDFIQDRRIAAGGPFFTGAAGDCSAPLVTPGKQPSAGNGVDNTASPSTVKTLVKLPSATASEVLHCTTSNVAGSRASRRCHRLAA